MTKMSGISPIVGLAAHLGRGVQRVATDAVVRGMRPFPRTAADLDVRTVARLTNLPVTSVSVIGGDAGTSSRIRLALTGENVPETVFVKLPAQTAATRLMGELGRLGDTEVRFYRQLRPELTAAPEVYGSAFDPVTGRYVVILEDLPADECRFPDILHPLGRDEAALVLEALALLHATFWGRLSAPGQKGPLDWVYSPSADHTSMLTGRLLKTSARRMAERSDIPVQVGSFIDENYRAAAQLIDRPPHTIMHGDAHPGNVYFRNGTAGLLDWQVVRRGHPSRELAYTVVTSMTPEDRQESQRDLLDVYRHALAAGGGPDLDRDVLWHRYRQGALYAYVAALITAGMGGMQNDDIACEGLRRGVAALQELDTVALLKKSL